MSKRQKRSKITITAILSLIITTATALLGGGCGTLKSFKMNLKIEDDSQKELGQEKLGHSKGVSGNYKDKKKTFPPGGQMCLNPGYIRLTSERGITTRSGTVHRWKSELISKEEYYKRTEPNNRKIKQYKTGCGKCAECRMKKADQWGVRGYLQTITEPNGIFITLTYNTENLPDGKELCKRDTQLFKKRLRELKEEYYQKKAESFIKTRQSKENKQKDNKQGK